MQELIGPIQQALGDSESVTLSCVVGRRGSLPMSRRAKMLVLEGGRCLGTVGGGCLEAEVYARSRELMRTGGVRVDSYSLTEFGEELQGHVCGGTVTILSDALRPVPSTIDLFTRLGELISTRTAAVLATVIPADEPNEASYGHVLVEAGGTFLADGPAPPGLVLERCVAALESACPEILDPAAGCERRYWLDPILPRPTAAVFGAGHCGRAIGRAAAEVGFRVVMFDDREPFLDPEAMPWAAGLRCIDFEAPLDPATLGHDPYLVIVTRGHDHDLALLRQLIDRPVAYMGMIGSRRKRVLFERALANEGVAAERLERLRSPMGLDIGADTPEEIAIAVVAEMIAVRRGAHAAEPSGSRARGSIRAGVTG